MNLYDIEQQLAALAAERDAALARAEAAEAEVERLKAIHASRSACKRCGGSGNPSDWEYNGGLASVCPACNGTGRSSS